MFWQRKNTLVGVGTLPGLFGIASGQCFGGETVDVDKCILLWEVYMQIEHLQDKGDNSGLEGRKNSGEVTRGE